MGPSVRTYHPGPNAVTSARGRLHGRRVVRGTLGLGDQELAIDELDLLARLEHAQLDQALVPRAAEAARLSLVTGHRANRIGRVRAGQRLRMTDALSAPRISDDRRRCYDRDGETG